MITHLNGAEIIKLSKIGEYATVTMRDGQGCNIKVRYLAICKYSNDTKLHLFSCSEKLEIIDDEQCDDLDEAISLAQLWTDSDGHIKTEWDFESSTL